MVIQLGYSIQIRDEGDRKIKLPVYFPEATTRTATSRSNSPAPQLPSILVDFTVINQAIDASGKSIQIFIGSDVLRRHNGDILFSTNNITLYDDQHCKLSIPMVRPEDEKTFKSLRIGVGPVPATPPLRKMAPPRQPSPLNGLRQTLTNESLPQSSLGSPALQPSPRVSFEKAARMSFGDDASAGSIRPSLEARPALSTMNTGAPRSPSLPSTAPRSASSTIWNSWRRDSIESKPSSSAETWGAKSGSSYQRRNEGIKVLRPTKPANRTFSATAVNSATSPVSAGSGQSRFFNDGAPRTSLELGSVGDEKEKGKEGPAPTGGKTRNANPVGGATAFSWLSK